MTESDDTVMYDVKIVTGRYVFYQTIRIKNLQLKVSTLGNGSSETQLWHQTSKSIHSRRVSRSFFCSQLYVDWCRKKKCKRSLKYHAYTNQMNFLLYRTIHSVRFLFMEIARSNERDMVYYENQWILWIIKYGTLVSNKELMIIVQRHRTEYLKTIFINKWRMEHYCSFCCSISF